MKSKTTILSLLFATAILSMSLMPGQSNRSPRKIMNHYRSEKGFISFSVPMFMARAFMIHEDKNIREALSDVHGIRLLICENACKNSGAIVDCMHDFSEYFRESGYVNIMQVKDGDETIVISAVPGEKCIRNMILIVSSEEDFVVIHLSGSMDMEEIKKLIEEDQI